MSLRRVFIDDFVIPTATQPPTITPTPVTAQIIVDNDDGSPAFTTSGSWGYDDSSTTDAYDGSFYYSFGGNGANSASFTPDLPQTGTYVKTIALRYPRQHAIPINL